MTRELDGDAAAIAVVGTPKGDLGRLIEAWVHPLLSLGDTEPSPEAVWWLTSKRATALINTWLNNKKLAKLHGDGVGAVLIPRASVAHARNSRATKDSVSGTGVVELLCQLFVHGAPKYSPHLDAAKYPTQLLMFDPNYKSTDASASGESPVAVLQFVGTPVPHLRMETAYWAKPAKTKALEAQALKK